MIIDEGFASTGGVTPQLREKFLKADTGKRATDRFIRWAETFRPGQ